MRKCTNDSIYCPNCKSTHTMWYHTGKNDIWYCSQCGYLEDMKPLETERGVEMKYYPICDDCVKGKGSECHNPICVYCFNNVPPKITNVEFGIDIAEYIRLDEMEIDKEKLRHRIMFCIAECDMKTLSSDEILDKYVGLIFKTEGIIKLK